MRKPPLHPACKLFPPIAESELQDLADDIAANGLRNPIVLYQGKLLDGRNRWEACKIAKVEPRFIEFEGNDPIAWVLSQNLARRHLTASQRAVVALDLLPMLEKEAKKRQQLLSRQNGNGDIFAGWKRDTKKDTPPKAVKRSSAEKRARLAAATLICGDSRKKLKDLPSDSVDLLLTDPPYPEVKREYGKMSEAEWHDLMQDVVYEAMRVVKPTGSAVFILQPNYRKVGEMRLWLWEFLLWAAKKWNLVQDVHWWAVDALPAAGTNRRQGLLRQSMKMCLWLGAPNCYRDQQAVLWEASDGHAARKWSDRALRNRPSGNTMRDGRAAETSAARGGTTPFNLLPIPNVDTRATGEHPSSTPYELAAWWCRYLLPKGGSLLDPFCGSGSTIQAGLDCGASAVTGIDKVRKYLTTARDRIKLT